MAETRHGAGADVSMILVPSLHPLDQCPDAHKMFAQMGYASLQVNNVVPTDVPDRFRGTVGRFRSHKVIPLGSSHK
jgi:hypothetical protein